MMQITSKLQALPAYLKKVHGMLYKKTLAEMKYQLEVGADGLTRVERELHANDPEVFAAYGDTLYEEAWREHRAREQRNDAMTAKAQAYLCAPI